MNNYKGHLTTSNVRNARSKSLVIISIILATCWLDLSFTASQATAESEASSEAGLEAPVNLRRRRRYRNRQQTQQNQNAQRERNQEAQARNRQQRLEQKQLRHGPQIKSYGNKRRQAGQTQQVQTQP